MAKWPCRAVAGKTAAWPAALAMRQVTLPRTTLTTSRLGFGCSGLMARLSRPESLRLLQTAADQGITHFDVARSYGYGEAESVLGDLIATRPGAFTIATKVGILPPRRSPGLATAKAIARRLAGLHPRLRQALQQGAAGMVRHGAFDLTAVQQSLETSLRALRVERVDLLLLHDCTYDDLQPGLLQFLERSRSEGKIGQFGLATDRETIRRAVAQRAAFAPIAQFAAGAATAPFGRPLIADAAHVPGIVTHSALGAGFPGIAGRVASDRASARRWTERFGVDVADRDSLGRLLLAAALSENPDGIVLFSSTRPETIAANAKLTEEPPLSSADVADLRQMILRTSAALGGIAA